MFIAPFSERTIEQALGAAATLLAEARRERAACFAASLIRGPAVLLGKDQEAARVLDEARCREAGAPVLRRESSGPAAFAGRRALLFTLALPHVAALFPDASIRTLLNRNVRPFLRGITAAGAQAFYFGRDWVSVHKQPAMALGTFVAEDGAILVEAIAGLDEPFVVPRELMSEEERAADRFLGRVPVALADVLPPGTAPEIVARRVADAFAARAPAPVAARPDLLEEGLSRAALGR